MLITRQGKVGEVLSVCTISAPHCGHRRPLPLQRRFPGLGTAVQLRQRRPAVRRRRRVPPEIGQLRRVAAVARRDSR